MDLHALGKGIVVLGLIVAAVGFLVMAAGKIPWLGRLPGDIVIKREHFSFYFPLATCLIVSLVVTLLLRFFGRR